MLHYHTAMHSRNLAVILILIFPTIPLIRSAPPRPFNLSHYLFPQVTAFAETSILPQPPHFLQGVVDAIASKEKWESDDLRVSDLDLKKAKYASVKRYEFRSWIREREVVLKMYEEPVQWKKLLVLDENGSSGFETLVRRLGSQAVIESFKLEGPLELRVVQDDDQFSLTLPPNSSYSGLRRIAVGKGITIEVQGAEEISIVHPPDNRQLPYGLTEVDSIWPSALCMVFPPIRVLGSASIAAYRTQRPTADIQTTFPSTDMIELLSDKCYVLPNDKKSRLPFGSLAFLQRILGSFFNMKAISNSASVSLKSQIKASTIFRFHLELERDIRNNDTYWSTLAEWRTKPTVERIRYEVAARLEGEILKPLLVKKVRPFIDVDSFTWSSLLSNISFTRFPPVLVPPEALTLDVKW